MDKETRGFIEDVLDGAIEKSDIRDVISWILDEYPIQSLEDLALGYMLGSLVRYAHNVVTSRKLEKHEKMWEEKFGRKPPWLETKGDVKPFRFNLTKKDVADIRDMLRRRILDIRDKIYRELNVQPIHVPC